MSCISVRKRKRERFILNSRKHIVVGQCRTWKHLEISFYGLRERRRCISNSLHHWFVLNIYNLLTSSNRDVFNMSKSVLMLIGKPIYYLEMAIGQFTSKGSVKALSAIPILKGVGVAQQIGTSCVVSYYCSLIALTMYYMFKSFTTQLPWAKCWPKWDDVLCIDATSTTANRTGAVVSSELYF